MAAINNFQFGYPDPGPQNPTGQDVMNNIYFCSEIEWLQLRKNEAFDYIVVGTGPCALAFVQRKLEKKPSAKILMLERGELFLPDHFQNLGLPFDRVMGGLSETFPWTLSKKTHDGKYIKYQHGTLPFFGGKSVMWSAWCPSPNDEEFGRWPSPVIEAAKKYFKDAKKLLNVVTVGKPPDSCTNGGDCAIDGMAPIYDNLQHNMVESIQANLNKVKALTRALSAPLAVGDNLFGRLRFKKFATPEPLLELVKDQQKLAKAGKGAELKIATHCTVTRIIQQEGTATALETSRGKVSVGNAKLVLAMGTIPPTTLILNSFPDVPHVGKHLAAHFISSIIARIPVQQFNYHSNLHDVELGAMYVAGESKGQQFHVQMSIFHDRDPDKYAKLTYMYAADVVATASMEQLKSSKGYLVFVCACLGEMSIENSDNHIRKNSGQDLSTNIDLQLGTNKEDEELWDVMDESAFELLEKVIAPEGMSHVQYWHGSPNDGKWKNARTKVNERRVPGTVHESSTMIIGDVSDAATSVGLDYRPHGVQNVYITGASMWPRSGSWNPTLTIVALAQHLADSLQ